MSNKVVNGQTRLIPVSQWNKFHVWPTVNSFRRMIKHSHETGLEKALVRIGKRWLVDETLFFLWVKNHNSLKKK